VTDAATLGLLGAAAAGTLSFLSPCVLPLVPGYVSYISGHSGDASALGRGAGRLGAAALSLCFILGFSLVFIAMGASASVLGRLLLSYRAELNLVGGLIVTLFGVFMIWPLRQLAWLHRDLRFHPQVKGGRPAAALVLGVAFGFGWTPCIGPILGAILTAGAMQSSLSGAVSLLGAYALGLGIPFLVAAIGIHELSSRLRRLNRFARPLQIAGGAIMVLMGVAMMTGQLTAFSYWLLERFPVLGQIG
jgi:cytochrome c-type biogenesis protein